MSQMKVRNLDNYTCDGVEQRQYATKGRVVDTCLVTAWYRGSQTFPDSQSLNAASDKGIILSRRYEVR